MQCAKVIIGMIGSSGISQLLENCLKKGPETFPDKNQRFCDPNQLYETIIRCHNSQILRNQWKRLLNGRRCILLRWLEWVLCIGLENCSWQKEVSSNAYLCPTRNPNHATWFVWLFLIIIFIWWNLEILYHGFSPPPWRCPWSSVGQRRRAIPEVLLDDNCDDKDSDNKDYYDY